MTTQGNYIGSAAGSEALFSSRGQQVMMRWEKQYMQAAVDALRVRIGERVLEIGFGLGYSASHIQSYKPALHCIIECDRETLQRAQQFAERNEGVQIVAGTWQQTLHSLGSFDCVFFDDYPLPELEERLGGWKRSRWHEFLDVALQHCAAGARISGYLARELDLSRPGCRVKLTRMEVDVPTECNYFPHETALVPVITVEDPVAAGRGVVEVRALPRASTKFLRAFENAGKTDQQHSGFDRARGQMEEIREFLLAHEMEALSHDECDDAEDEMEMNCDGVAPVGKRTCMDDDGRELGGSQHYVDEQSRREYLRSMRKKAAAAKCMES